MSASNDDQKPPSLRIRELTITNFRTFVEPTTISFCDADGNADAIVVFHGDNGSGKSNALAALDLFFQTASLLLRVKEPEGDVLVPWDKEWYITGQRGGRPIYLKYTDRPANRGGSMEIMVRFDDARLGTLKATYTPAGKEVLIRFLRDLSDEHTNAPTNFATIAVAERAQFLNWLESPQGPESASIKIFDTRRSQKGAEINGSRRTLMPSHLVRSLYRMQTSKLPVDRNDWRDFKNLLARFTSFMGAEITIEYQVSEDNDHGKSKLELVVENPGKTVLSLDELSSGEQHVIVLCAASLLARSAILAIEEPEISLDAKNQELLHNILNELAQKGLIDQIILESHVARFDGPNVIRFTRNDDGSTSVRREASVDESKREVERLAKEKGAEHLWVTRDGYTKLPEKMVNDLGAGHGGHVWFLKGPEHWEAWPEAHVDHLFRGGNGHDD